MFGIKIVSESYLSEIEKRAEVYNRVIQAHRWFAVYRPFDEIWTYILDPGHGGIAYYRDQFNRKAKDFDWKVDP